MKLQYDTQTDSLYIGLAERPAADSRAIAEGVVADFDSEGRLVGLDIEHAQTRLDLSSLETDNLPTRSARVA